jgi:hypothetical protein
MYKINITYVGTNQNTTTTIWILKNDTALAVMRVDRTSLDL